MGEKSYCYWTIQKEPARCRQFFVCQILLEFHICLKFSQDMNWQFCRVTQSLHPQQCHHKDSGFWRCIPWEVDSHWKARNLSRAVVSSKSKTPSPPLPCPVLLLPFLSCLASLNPHYSGDLSILFILFTFQVSPLLLSDSTVKLFQHIWLKRCSQVF